MLVKETNKYTDLLLYFVWFPWARVFIFVLHLTNTWQNK